MAKPDIEPGIYMPFLGDIKEMFLYKGEEPEKKERSYFNMLIYHPDGSTSQTFENSALVRSAKKIKPQEQAEKLEKKAEELNKLAKWLRSDSIQ